MSGLALFLVHLLRHGLTLPPPGAALGEPNIKALPGRGRASNLN
jgi:hypothetical protein